MPEFAILLAIMIILILEIFTLRNLKWIIKEIRSVCSIESGYVKLMQLAFFFVVAGSFLISLIRDIIYPRNASTLDIFMAVIAAFMGTISVMFFSDKSMESIKQDRDKKRLRSANT